MITITKKEENFIFEVKGMHKLWSFKSQLIIPIIHIINAHQDFDSVKSWWKGWRAPGTHVPFVITAGTFYKDNDKNFWDVSDSKKTIIIELKDEEYQHLIIEVENPAEAIEMLKK